ncbi:hypothetical protein J5N97_013280 [Dioscorea zingiberensis]|uniref:Uncharacterized protein n=1 Tax=Dioscorea zingiberensis TaxID=325984 RepID=A0A9D5HIH4_9LILI|nr:hypothetical protein J5N97_013280 [Dioscorea zingiberensis]
MASVANASQSQHPWGQRKESRWIDSPRMPSSSGLGVKKRLEKEALFAIEKPPDRHLRAQRALQWILYDLTQENHYTEALSMELDNMDDALVETEMEATLGLFGYRYFNSQCKWNHK